MTLNAQNRRVIATCMKPECAEPWTVTFIGHKATTTGDLTYRTCKAHKFDVAFGLIRFGLAERVTF